MDRFTVNRELNLYQIVYLRSPLGNITQFLSQFYFSLLRCTMHHTVKEMKTEYKTQVFFLFFLFQEFIVKDETIFKL